MKKPAYLTKQIRKDVNLEPSRSPTEQPADPMKVLEEKLSLISEGVGLILETLGARLEKPVQDSEGEDA